MASEKNVAKKISSKKNFRPIRTIFYVVSKNVIFTTDTNIQYPNNSIKLPSYAIIVSTPLMRINHVGRWQHLPTCANMQVYYLGKKTKPTNLYINLLSQLKLKNTQFNEIRHIFSGRARAGLLRACACRVALWLAHAGLLRGVRMQGWVRFGSQAWLRFGSHAWLLMAQTLCLIACLIVRPLRT